MKEDATVNVLTQIFNLLTPIEPGERIRILQTVQAFFGVVAVMPQSSINQNKSVAIGASDSGDAKQFFDRKEPKNKGEDFAVAAKFSIENGQGDVHTLDSLKNIIKSQAKRRFDAQNFVRDMSNAVQNAKLFMCGDTKGEYVLSAHGEKYVDALPDRAAAKVAKKSTKKIKKAKKKKAA